MPVVSFCTDQRATCIPIFLRSINYCRSRLKTNFSAPFPLRLPRYLILIWACWALTITEVNQMLCFHIVVRQAKQKIINIHFQKKAESHNARADENSRRGLRILAVFNQGLQKQMLRLSKRNTRRHSHKTGTGADTPIVLNFLCGWPKRDLSLELSYIYCQTHSSRMDITGVGCLVSMIALKESSSCLYCLNGPSEGGAQCTYWKWAGFPF